MIKIAYARSQKKDHTPEAVLMFCPCVIGNPLEPAKVIGRITGDSQPWIILQENLHTALKRRSGQIDRQIMEISLPSQYRFDKEAGLLGRATPELYQPNVLRTWFRYSGDYLMGARAQNFRFGAGKIILGKAADRFEQMRAKLVVKVFRRQSLRIRCEPGLNIASKRV